MGQLQPRRQPATRTLIGALLSLAAPVLYALWIGPSWFGGRADEPAGILTGLATMWLLAAAVVLYVVGVERRPLRSIGLARPPRAWVLQALGIGVALSLLVPILSGVASFLVPPSQAGTVASAVRMPWWLMLLGVMTAAVTEEILFRGYPLERLTEWFGSSWWSGLVALAAFAVAHAEGWNATHIIGVVLPMGAALTGMYLWRRNLIVVMIVHLMIDLPLVVMALGAA